MKRSSVYFSDFRIRPGDNQEKKLIRLLNAAGMDKIDFQDKYVAIKMSFGERGNLAALRVNYARYVVDYIKRLGGHPFVTDCNTLYVGYRKNALDHIDTAYIQGYTAISLGCHVIIADGLKGTDDVDVPVVGGEYCDVAHVGRALMDADILISLTHFKGHELTGFGGTLKNIGMGGGSRGGKMHMHASGKPVVVQEKCVGCGACRKICAHQAPVIQDGKCVIDHALCAGCGRCIGSCPKDAVVRGTADAGERLNCKIAEYTKAIVYGRPHFHISVANQISPYCDCHSENDTAIVPDVGIFASYDPVAIDVACADAVNAQPINPNGILAERDSHIHDVFERITPNSNWKSCVSHGEKIGLGTQNYELIRVK